MTNKSRRTDDAISYLHERDLIRFSSDDFGWVEGRPKLSDTVQSELVALLAMHLPAERIDIALSILHIGFSDAAEAAVIELRAALDAKLSKDAKKPSSKLGVRLRSQIYEVTKALESGEMSPEEICTSILSKPELAKLITVHLEEVIRPLQTDPLEREPCKAVEHLPAVLQDLRRAIHDGITRAPVEASHDILVKAVVSALTRATGKAPTRNWDAHDNEESGFGLKCCRILARELNLALPADLTREKPLDMARAWRRGTEKTPRAF
ncbi:hypothetical protein SuNHUV7_20200 (plasmid) [Pseudoseohaeicola sp. NH-UV-7]|uniref:hypothetical protein n=1 Tax=Sulfitobacter sp. TBRI5 TaxID=2989732 RepID=UPI003A5F2809